ncbi:MAG: hypothetical protein IPO53_05020 [Chitinophagaceae bacterium]|nr:hypothetical protein [Chitinophagaceae bacterium]
MPLSIQLAAPITGDISPVLSAFILLTNTLFVEESLSRTILRIPFGIVEGILDTAVSFTWATVEINEIEKSM